MEMSKEYLDDRMIWILVGGAVLVVALFYLAFFMPQPKPDLSCYDLIIKAEAEGGMARLWKTNGTGIILCEKQILSGNCVCKFSLNNGTVIYTTEDLMPKWRYYEKDDNK